jgi:hypothetical protein
VRKGVCHTKRIGWRERPPSPTAAPAFFFRMDLQWTYSTMVHGHGPQESSLSL